MESIEMRQVIKKPNDDHGQAEIIASTPCRPSAAEISDILFPESSASQYSETSDAPCLTNRKIDCSSSSECHPTDSLRSHRNGDVTNFSTLNAFPYRVRSPAPAKRNSNGKRPRTFHETSQRSRDNFGIPSSSKASNRNSAFSLRQFNTRPVSIQPSKSQTNIVTCTSPVSAPFRRSTMYASIGTTNRRLSASRRWSSDQRPTSLRRENPKLAGVAHWETGDPSLPCNSSSSGPTSSSSQYRLRKLPEGSIVDFSSEASSRSGLHSISDAFPRLAGTPEVCDYLSKASQHVDDESLVWLLHSSSVDPSKVSPKDRTLLWTLKQAVDTNGQNTSGLAPGTDPASGSLCFWRLDDNGERENRISVRCAEFVAWLQQHQRKIDGGVPGARKGKAKDPLDSAVAMDPPDPLEKPTVDPAARLEQHPDIAELIKHHNMPVAAVKNEEIDVLLALPAEARGAFLDQVRRLPSGSRPATNLASHAPQRRGRGGPGHHQSGVFIVPNGLKSPNLWMPPKSPLAQMVSVSQSPDAKGNAGAIPIGALPPPVMAKGNCAIKKGENAVGERAKKQRFVHLHRLLRIRLSVLKWMGGLIVALAILGGVMYAMHFRHTEGDRM